VRSSQVAAVRRSLLLVACPLTLLFAGLAAYATISCRALDPFSWQWSLLLVFPVAMLGSGAGMLQAALAGDERRGLLSLVAAAAAMVLWIDLAFGSVF
jgi:hypothetical protein